MWLAILRSTGVRASLAQGGESLIVDDTTFRLRRRASLRLGAVPPVDPGAVLWLPRASKRVAEALTESGWSWVTDTGMVWLRLPDRTIGLGLEQAVAEPDTAERLARRPPAELAVLGHLLEHPGAHRQTALATALGITQPRVSQILRAVHSEGLVVRASGGWEAARLDALFDLCTASSDLPGINEGWYHLEQPTSQIDLCLNRAVVENAASRVSGDWAADRIAPWRLPATAVIHLDRSLDLEAAGFVPAAPSDATLLTTVRKIPPSWQIAPEVRAALTTDPPEWPLAPVHQIARDLIATGGPDAEEATEHLKSRFLAIRANLPKAP